MNEQDTMTDAEFDAAVKQMGDAGKRDGKNAASWLCDGNTTQEAAQALLDQIEGCTLDVPAPFSGEWAGDDSLAETIDRETECDVEGLTMEEEDELARAYEDGYSEAYAIEAERLARFYAAD